MSTKFFAVFFLVLTIAWGHAAFAQNSRLISGVAPDNPEVVEGVRAALHGDDEIADKHFASARSKNPGGRPGGIDAAMAFTDSQFDAQFYGKMRFWLERTAEHYPDDPEAYFLLADIALFERRGLECSMLVERGLQAAEPLNNAPRQRSLLIYGEKIRASLAEWRQRWAEAETQYKKLRELDPENADHAHKLGLVLFQLGQKENAVEMLTTAETKDPKLLPANIVLARLSADAGQTAEAQQYLEAALKAGAKDVRVLCAAAELEIKWDHLEQAAALAEKAERLEPHAIDPIILQGILDLYAGRYEKAEERFTLVTASIPDESRALTGLALALCEQRDAKQLRKALSVAKRNVDLYPNSMDAQTTLAWVLMKTDALDEAEQILRRHFDAGELNSPGAYYMAVLLYRQDRKDEARHFLQAALETKNNFPKRAEAEMLLKAMQK